LCELSFNIVIWENCDWLFGEFKSLWATSPFLLVWFMIKVIQFSSSAFWQNRTSSHAQINQMAVVLEAETVAQAQQPVHKR